MHRGVRSVRCDHRSPVAFVCCCASTATGGASGVDAAGQCKVPHRCGGRLIRRVVNQSAAADMSQLVSGSFRGHDELGGQVVTWPIFLLARLEARNRHRSQTARVADLPGRKKSRVLGPGERPAALVRTLAIKKPGPQLQNLSALRSRSPGRAESARDCAVSKPAPPLHQRCRVPHAQMRVPWARNQQKTRCASQRG
jgi:hypothetical protein